MVVSEKPTKNATSKQERKHRLKHRFEVVKKLGQGTYGKVQLAINKETSQEVAIKTIKKSKIESEQDLVRIRREIQIMSSIQHPQIIHIYEVFENKEKIVLVMQYASGGELYDYLSERKVLTDTEARRIFRQIAAAIYYCHKNKICHRDLKLENVLLDERGNAKIADFGLSNVFDDRHLLGTFCGSPLYASPEIVKGTPYYGPEVDCWSMGVLLYTLVYGAMPFDGSNFKRLVKQISEGDYYEPKKKSDASGLIRQLLTVDAAKRASIIDICTNWWVNQGYEHSLLQVAEDMANLTPVRIDLLLALAPVSPPPPNEAEEKKEHPLAKKNEKEQKEQIVEGAPSDSFSFISGGMANNMKTISSENPDDIFHGEENSDEEFLPADVAAALEGQCVKRPAEKSFDGSMVRVSSVAHRNKKPRKSDSVHAPANAVKTENDKKDSQEEESMNAVKEEQSNIEMEQEAVRLESQQPMPDDATVQMKEAASVSSENASSVPITIPDENEVSTDEKEAHPIVEQESNVADDDSTETKPVASLPPEVKNEVKKPKPKIPPKVATEKLKKETSPTKVTSVQKNQERSNQKIAEKRERSPQKGQVVKPQERRDRSPQKSKPEERRDRSPQKSQIQRRDPSPQKNQNQKSPQEKRDPSPQKKSPDKSADASKRRPGKLIMPKFLDSNPSSSPSPPKSADAKKVIVPYRSVSDAKKAFEVKNRNSSSVQKKEEKQTSPNSTKKDEKPTTPGKRIIHRKKNITTADKTEEASKSSPEEPKSDSIVSSPGNENTPTPVENCEAPFPLEETTLPPQESRSPIEQKPAIEESESASTATDVAATNEQADGDVTPTPSEDDEGKKIAAKSILKKTIAKAKLAERKLSQQSSMDSESGSCTPPVLPVTPNSSSKSSVVTTGPSYFKVPKPFVKEELTNKIESKAEITLSPTQKSAPTEPFSPSVEETSEAKSEQESIWGPPTPSDSRPLQRSVLSSSIESDMNNWRHEVEESLKRLSPEGASDDRNNQNNKESGGQDIGPTPIARSYKKFTFTKDGSCITETGEVYTTPRDDGTWTKVEKKTKVTTMPSIKEDYNVAKHYHESSPLRHSDSQSSSGSNDIFDDIFDSWTGDTMICNRMKNLFGRFSDSFRKERRRESYRRPKVEKDKFCSGNLTDRESSDNEEDFDVHLNNEQPVMYGSHGLWQLLKSVNRDMPMRTFREFHGPSYSRSLSRERRDSDAGFRSRDASRPTDYYPVRSTSRDRTQSPRETVLKFVIGSPRKQNSVQSEPRGYNEAWRDRASSQHESWDRSDSDNIFQSPIDSPEARVDRASVYGTIRPKVFQRYMKMRNEYPESSLTPQSTKSGPELLSKSKTPVEDLDENRRQRVEHWLQMSDRDPEPHRAKYYTRSSSDNISNLEGTGNHCPDERKTPSMTSLDDSRQSFRSEIKVPGNPPMYRTISEVQFNNRMTNSPDSMTSRQHSLLEEQLPCRPPLHNVKYTRSLSNNLNQMGITTPPNSVIEMETPMTPPSSGQQTPVLRMRVSFNRNSSQDSQQQPRELPSSAGLWSQMNSQQSDYTEGKSLLEALKMRGYRNVMSQRLHNAVPAEQGPPPESSSPPERGIEQDQGTVGETPQRGKAPRYASTPKADNKSNDACCMETNHSEKTIVPNGEVSDGTLTPDSLDGKVSSTGKTKNYEEESVSDRIRRKSYFMRFNDDRPKRRLSRYRESYVSDLPGSIWSRFSEDPYVEDDDLLLYSRMPRRTGSFRSQKRSSANLEDLLDYRMSTDGLYRSSSRSSQLLDGFLSDDGLWNSSYSSRRSSTTSSNGYHGSNYSNGVYNDEPGSLWKQRTTRSLTRYPYIEPSVVDTVPDLSEIWKSSRPSAFSFYSPTVTPKSPVMSPNNSAIPTNSVETVSKGRVLVGLSEEMEDHNGQVASSLVHEKEEYPQDVLNKALDTLSSLAEK